MATAAKKIWLPNTERQYYPELDHGERASTKGVVIHVNDGTYNGTLSWFHKDGGVGAHLEIGRDHVVQLVPLNRKCWHAVNANTNTIGFEHAGMGKQSRADWLHSGHELAFSANRAAWVLHEYGLGRPRRGRNVFAHSDGGAAWGAHDCPGPHFPWDVWMGMCLDAYMNHWGR